MHDGRALHCVSHLASCLSPAQAQVDGTVFVKDLTFYLLAVVTVAACQLDGNVTAWEIGLMAAMYVVYVMLTFYVSKGHEPVHTDIRQHELPPEKLIDGERAGRGHLMGSCGGGEGVPIELGLWGHGRW